MINDEERISQKARRMLRINGILAWAIYFCGLTLMIVGSGKVLLVVNGERFDQPFVFWAGHGFIALGAVLIVVNGCELWQHFIDDLRLDKNPMNTQD